MACYMSWFSGMLAARKVKAVSFNADAQVRLLEDVISEFGFRSGGDGPSIVP